MSNLQRTKDVRPRFGGLAAVRDFASRLPGAEIAREVYQGVEEIALTELKQRLDSIAPENRPSITDASSATLAKKVHPRELLASLIDEATEQDSDEAKRSLYTALLLQLTPDEACMLAALSDGTEFALIDVAVGNPLTGVRAVARNFCSIDRGAAVKLRGYVPAYISHLGALGLAELGPEQTELDMKYQILEGSQEVQALSKKLKSQHKSVRFLRKTLHITALGKELWAYCDPAESAHR